MATYQWSSTEELSLEEIDLGFRRYRLERKGTEEAMAQSLRRYGQLSPLVICDVDGRRMLVDGFKRYAAAREVKGLDSLWTRQLEVDASTAKAAVYTLNSMQGAVQALEEAWIVHALVREDGLSQPAVATLLGRHKSWVCRRLALLEKLAESAREELGLGLISTTVARQLTRLPAGNQVEVLEALRRESLSAAETRDVIDLLLASGTDEKRRYVLEKPREAIRESQADEPRGWDPRLSAAGNKVACRLTILLDLLGSMQTWLLYRGRGVLRPMDRQPLREGFERLQQEAGQVAELTTDFLEELHLP